MKQIMAVVAVVLGLMAGSAQASLMGNTVQCSTNTGITCNSTRDSPVTAVVGVGPEFTLGYRSEFPDPDLPDEEYLSVDFGTNNVLFTALGHGWSFSVTVVSLSDLTNAFTSASLISVSDVTGFDASDVTLTGGILSVNLAGSYFRNAGSTVNIALSTASVPEPGTVVLLSLSLGVMGLMARRKQA